MGTLQNPAVSEFLSWARSHDAFFHPSLKFTHTPLSGATITTTAPLSPGTDLIRCPHVLAIDSTKAASSFPDAIQSSISPHALMRLFLCHERLREKDSFWYPYIRTLPVEFNTPLYFSEDDKRFLEGCNLGLHDIEQRREAWQNEWRDGVDALGRHGIDVEGYSWELYLWAATVLTSRSFSQDLIQWNNSTRAEYKLQTKESSVPVLFPLIDTLNHRPKALVTWQPETSALSLVLDEAYSAGDEVFNNYGSKGNEELLMGYGFALADNPSDTVTLKFSPPLSSSQAAIRCQQIQSSDDGIYYLGLSATPCFPSELTSLFRILIATAPEIPILTRDPTIHRVSIRNELATYTQLMLAMQRKLSGLRTDVGTPKNARQEVAKVYRDGQIRILASAASYASEVVASLLGSAEVASLVAALREPKFREVAVVVFGTVEIRELRDAELEDEAFALYICWKYICREERWKRWFEYLERFYGGPTEIEEPLQDGVQEMADAISLKAADGGLGVFACKKWDARLLAWSMRIYTDEGVRTTGGGGETMCVVSLEVPGTER